MRISVSQLLSWWTPPSPLSFAAIRHLLDDVGIEVKRVEDDGAALALELLANRGDHRAYLGIARELYGRLGGALELPEIDPVVIGASPVPLTLQTALCLRYSATALELPGALGGLAGLSADALAPLLAAGLASVNAAVDASNLSNLELGQPTHLFDADTLVGGITIREAQQGETCRPLFANKVMAVPPGAIVIADDEKILAIAGVIGCEESKVTGSTRRMILESATFDPVAVRRASRSLGIHTDAAARFERGADPSLVEVGAGRVIALLRRHAGAVVVGETGVVGDWADPRREITVSAARVTHTLGRSFGVDEIHTRLGRLGFECRIEADHVLARVPPGRLWDVVAPEDLYEELARSVGYNELPVTLPADTVGVLPSPAQIGRERVESLLLASGFYEVITNGFYGRSLIEPLRLPAGHPLQEHVSTLNALDKGFSLLKNNALVQAVETVAQASRYGLTEVRAYEFTRYFQPDSAAPNGLCRERPVLWAICSGPARPPSWQDKPGSADVWLMRGLVEEIATELRISLTLQPGDAASARPITIALHPARRATILHEGVAVGVLGEVEPDVVAGFGLKRARPIYLELDADVLRLNTQRGATPMPPARAPSVRNLAFTLPHRVEAQAIAATLLRTTGSELTGEPSPQAVVIRDVYAHEEDGKPVRTVTYELSFSQEPIGYGEEPINAAVAARIGIVEAEWGDRGVHLRRAG